MPGGIEAEGGAAGGAGGAAGVGGIPGSLIPAAAAAYGDIPAYKL